MVLTSAEGINATPFMVLMGGIFFAKGYYIDRLPTDSSPAAWTAQGPGCTCPFTYDPVCGKDGFTYVNICEALCDGMEVHYPGMCAANDEDQRVNTTEEECTSCPILVKWVCGVDGNNYASGCAATCNGIQVAYAGTCAHNEDKRVF